ncbi:LysR family transcriptional regulator [Paenibacillus farraposensis]|uniref:LysR family transcriptional regulator n=1 Tax=Paenibacillus farraposensis TaxID=2807095 RepID=UPI00360781C4
MAEALQIKQPTVSFHMKSLEKEMGVPLFSLQRGRIMLTEAGKKCYLTPSRSSPWSRKQDRL